MSSANITIVDIMKVIDSCTRLALLDDFDVFADVSIVVLLFVFLLRRLPLRLANSRFVVVVVVIDVADISLSGARSHSLASVLARHSDGQRPFLSADRMIRSLGLAEVNKLSNSSASFKTGTRFLIGGGGSIWLPSLSHVVVSKCSPVLCSEISSNWFWLILRFLLLVRRVVRRVAVLRL